MTTTRKPFTTISPAILDTIACCVWPADGRPKELTPPREPLDLDGPLAIEVAAPQAQKAHAWSDAQRARVTETRGSKSNERRRALLTCLARAPQPLTSWQVATVLGCTQRSAATRLVDAALAGGLVKIVGTRSAESRSGGHANGIARLWEITDAGRAALTPTVRDAGWTDRESPNKVRAA